jgi:F0F1-type ATP synthase delta subunit
MIRNEMSELLSNEIVKKPPLDKVIFSFYKKKETSYIQRLLLPVAIQRIY